MAKEQYIAMSRSHLPWALGKRVELECSREILKKKFWIKIFINFKKYNLKKPRKKSYYEFFSTLDDDNETTQGDWKQFAKREEAVDYLYKNFVPVLYMNGIPIDEYPTNKFTEQEKGFVDTFFKGRDGRTWMLDPEGFHIVYCATNATDGDYGIGLHWANEIELALPVSRFKN